EALATLGDGWMTHHDSIRAPVAAYPAAGASAFPDPITRLIDAERRAYFEQPGRHFESVHVLVVTYLPPKKTAARLERYVFTGEAAPSLGDMALAKFRSVLNELEGRLGALFQMERLRGERVEDAHGQTHIRDPLLSYFHWCITGIRQPINLPPVPMYLDAVIGGQDLSGGTAPKIGAQHIRVVAIEGFPQESYPGILAALDEIPVYCRWSTRFIYLDPWNAQKGLERFRRMWEQKQRPLTDQIFNKASTRIDLDAQAMTDDALEAKSEASSNVVRYGYLTSVVVLMDEALAAVDAAADEVATLIRNLGFGARIETVNALEAWLGSLSGHGSANLRRPPLNTLNLAHLVPLSTVWTGLDHCPCPFYPPDSPPLMVGVTDGSTPFHFNLHVGDVGHALILGPIGSGKSTLLAMLMAQFRRYPGATIFAFDKQCSAYTICVAAGGRHYDLSAETGALGLAPLSRLESAADIAWAAGWIEMLVRLQGVSMAPRRREEIHRALVGLREKPDPRLRTVSDFCAEVQDDEVRLALRPYRLGGAFGALFDAEEDGIKDEDFQVFELDELMKLGEQAVLPALSYLFYRIKLRLRGQPALIPLDECWMMFDHPVFREELREWLKEFRRANGAVVMATQSPADAIDSGIFDVINESCH
ncbi:MAG: conjugal transfer protein TrbE, partial [Rhodobacteraceae bacterium]|nr:conjugal transfer protein TrbE [Paracoccaceae bacterium]